MSGSILSSSLSALLASQRALAVTGNNIANVNTEGYSRQTISFAQRLPTSIGVGFIGSGVDIATVERVLDRFVNSSLTSAISREAQQRELGASGARLADFFADPAAGLSPRLERFFTALEDVASDPTSIAARTAFLSEAESLANSFNALERQLSDAVAQSNANLSASLDVVNTTASRIASLNAQLKGSAAGDPRLLDEREQAVRRLAEMIGVTTVEQDGDLNVFVGSGQPLVLGGRSESLSLSSVSGDLLRPSIVVSSAAGQPVDLTRRISGGTISGTLEFRDRMVAPAQAELGRIAVALTEQFNGQLQQGVDLLGQPGVNLFAPLTDTAARVLFNPANSSSAVPISVSITDATALTASDYTLRATGGDFILTRRSDGEEFDLTAAMTAIPAEAVTVDGLTITLTGALPADGDRFTIQPTANALGSFAALSLNPAQLAVAGGPPPGAAGDNQNALALVELRNARLVGGAATLAESYRGMVAALGSRTAQAQSTAALAAVQLDSAISQRESISGVNLEEEAANLLRYQQSFAAAARAVQVADDVFQTLLRAVGG